MSEDTTKETTKETTASEEQSTEVTTDNKSVEELKTMNSTLLTEVKDLRTESKGRRLKLEEFEKAEQAKADEELDFKARYEKEVTAHQATKDTGAVKDLQTEFVSKSIEAGIDPKIANLLGKAADDLTADNMVDKVKAAKKEFPSTGSVTVEEAVPQSPFFNAQPTSDGDRIQDITDVDLNAAAAQSIVKKLKLK